MTKSKIFLYLCLSFIGGIFLNSYNLIYPIYFLLFLVVGIILAFSKKLKPLFLIACFLSLGLGIWRHQAFELKVSNNEFKNYIKDEETVILIGVVNKEPSIGGKSTKIEFQPEGIEGKILLFTWKYPEYKYGDRLKVKGTIEEPQPFEGFNYKEYLAKDGIYSLIYFPKIELVGEGSGSFFMKTLFSIKSKLKDIIAKIMPLPQAGLLEALLFGDEENIPEHWKEKFNLTGTRHIAAVSGMNITIVSSLVLGFFLFLGFWRNQAFYLSIILILLYVLAIGAPASGVRAAIMGILFLTAQYFGRVSSGLRTIVFSAALMLFLNPLLLKSDMGFQLSFFAILGLVYLQPLFLDFFKKIPNFFELRYSLAATLAAQAFVLPLLIYNFGQIPLIGPISNVFIVPLLALITILGFFLAILGIN
jgi:competence protein ComEC